MRPLYRQVNYIGRRCTTMRFDFPDVMVTDLYEGQYATLGGPRVSRVSKWRQKWLPHRLLEHRREPQYVVAPSRDPSHRKMSARRLSLVYRTMVQLV